MSSTFCLFSAFGDCFATIGVRDPYPQACEVFSQFGDYHRKMEKLGIQTIKAIKPVSEKKQLNLNSLLLKSTLDMFTNYIL